MAESRKSIALVNGPNLNRLGTRKPNLYGQRTLDEVADELTIEAARLGFNLVKFQSNHEGELIDFIQSLSSQTVGIILNPGALMMAGYSLRDAIEDSHAPVIEIHISNIWSREPFRHHSVLSAVCRGVISGFGISGYSLALKALYGICQNGEDSKMLTLPRKLTTKSQLLMEPLAAESISVRPRAKKTNKIKNTAEKKENRQSSSSKKKSRTDNTEVIDVEKAVSKNNSKNNSKSKSKSHSKNHSKTHAKTTDKAIKKTAVKNTAGKNQAKTKTRNNENNSLRNSSKESILSATSKHVGTKYRISKSLKESFRPLSLSEERTPKSQSLTELEGQPSQKTTKGKKVKG